MNNLSIILIIWNSATAKTLTYPARLLRILIRTLTGPTSRRLRPGTSIGQICLIPIVTLILLLSGARVASTSAPVYDVRAFGARGDGKTLDTAAINKAIDVAAAAGGGTVNFPAGTYLSVSIRLRSNITLRMMVQKNASNSEPNRTAALRTSPFPTSRSTTVAGWRSKQLTADSWKM